jgi:hypothetical protein
MYDLTTTAGAGSKPARCPCWIRASAIAGLAASTVFKVRCRPCHHVQDRAVWNP